MKRIAGVPGDRVQIKEGHLYLNGAEVPQRADGEMNIGEGYMEQRASVFVETLPDGRSYRILDLGNRPGDNTEIFVVPPGHYFVLGDNRDNSNDSRNDIGFVHEDDIVGKVALVWFDGRTKAFAWRAVH